jgi:hypothetical protein
MYDGVHKEGIVAEFLKYTDLFCARFVPLKSTEIGSENLNG